MNATTETPDRVAENGGSRSQQRDCSTATTDFKLTPKEELAVIIQRLKSHEESATNEKCKVRLAAAIELIRSAMIWR